MRPKPIEEWREIVKTRDLARLERLLAEDVVFISPVVHTPQAGRAITMKYLAGALAVLNNDSFHYLNEWHGERSSVLEFATTIQGVEVNGVDLVFWDESGRITRFKVMVRPLKAINMLHQMMGAQLAASGAA